MELATHACLVAKDAAYNLRDFLASSSRMAVLTLHQCEKELDMIERHIDEIVPEAMVRVGEQTARELLASVRFITDLERIGDLLLWVAERPTIKDLGEKDRAAITEMVEILERMLEQIHDGVRNRNLDNAMAVLHEDRELDRIRRSTFDRHLQGTERRSRSESIDVLFVVQSIERAGDHATNLAEELVHLIEHRSIRHRKRTSQQ
jgi:phosphate transport system protein